MDAKPNGEVKEDEEVATAPTAPLDSLVASPEEAKIEELAKLLRGASLHPPPSSAPPARVLFLGEEDFSLSAALATALATGVPVDPHTPPPAACWRGAKFVATTLGEDGPVPAILSRDHEVRFRVDATGTELAGFDHIVFSCPYIGTRDTAANRGLILGFFHHAFLSADLGAQIWLGLAVSKRVDSAYLYSVTVGELLGEIMETGFSMESVDMDFYPWANKKNYRHQITGGGTAPNLGKYYNQVLYQFTKSVSG